MTQLLLYQTSNSNCYPLSLKYGSLYYIDGNIINTNDMRFIDTYIYVANESSQIEKLEFQLLYQGVVQIEYSIISIAICKEDCQYTCDINNIDSVKAIYNCAACTDPLQFLVEGSASCESSIRSHYYKDEKKKMIRPCNSRCDECNNSNYDKRYKCASCTDGFIMNSECERNLLSDDGKVQDNNLFISCPGSFRLTEHGSYVCVGLCPSAFPYLLVSTNICVKECTEKEMLSNSKCVEPFPTEVSCPLGQSLVNDVCVSENKTIANSEIKVDKPLDEILSTINDPITSLVDLNSTIKGDNFTIQIYHPDNPPIDSENISSIDISQCETILKEYYHLPENEQLIIAKFDLYSNNTLTPNVEYVIYDSMGNILNQKVCEAITDDVSYPTVNGTLNFDLVENMSQQGIDILNISDPYFNDICEINTINGTDRTIAERRNEIFIKGEFCDDGCEYNGYNITTKKI